MFSPSPYWLALVCCSALIAVSQAQDCSTCAPDGSGVCGADGLTYTNACQATCRGIQIAYAAQCVEAGAKSAYGFGSVSRVVIVGMGSLPQDALSRNTPNLQRIRDAGSSSTDMRSENPSQSLPNWASLLYGAPPSLHGVTGDDWTPSSARLTPQQGRCYRYPNLFSVAQAQKPSLVTGGFYSRAGFPDLVSSDAVTVFRGFPCTSCGECATAESTMLEAFVSFLATRGPQISFIEFESITQCVEENGVKSDEVQEALTRLDSWLGTILQTLTTLGHLQQTLVLVATDHPQDECGWERGLPSASEISSTFVAYSGSSAVQPGTIPWPVSIIDVVPTALFALGLNQPVQMTGRPILPIFNMTSSNRLSAVGWSFADKAHECPDDTSRRCPKEDTTQPFHTSSFFLGLLVMTMVLGLGFVVACCIRFLNPPRSSLEVHADLPQHVQLVDDPAQQQQQQGGAPGIDRKLSMDAGSGVQMEHVAHVDNSHAHSAAPAPAAAKEHHHHSAAKTTTAAAHPHESHHSHGPAPPKHVAMSPLAAPPSKVKQQAAAAAAAAAAASSPSRAKASPTDTQKRVHLAPPQSRS